MADEVKLVDLVPYAIATVLNLAITVLPVFKVSFLASITALKADTDLEEKLLLSRPRFGRSMGFLERQIYIYALATRSLDLFTAVVVFKAFAEWVKPAAPPAEKLGVDDGQNILLARFYAYTIGNLLSILWAVAIHEASTRVMKPDAALSLGTLLAASTIIAIAAIVADIAYRHRADAKAAQAKLAAQAGRPPRHR